MRRTLSVTDMARNFARYINRVAFRGERFVLTRGDQPVAELGPVPRGRHLGELRDLLASLPHLAEGDADAFAADILAGRAELDALRPQSPWPS
jgi:antitoxin (DNA-binding transcriptional repressor) of toxin-antitoxin stability system